MSEPRSFRRLRRDHRGMPIPYLMSGISQTTMSPERFHEIVTKKLCMVCGEKLGNKKWFLGGYRAMVNRLFVDPAMHEECAHYSLKRCPFLSNPVQKYHKKPSEGATFVDQVAVGVKRAAQVLMRTNGYQVVIYDGQPMVLANAWEHVEFWRRGERLSEPPEDAPTVERWMEWLRRQDVSARFTDPYQSWANAEIKRMQG